MSFYDDAYDGAFEYRGEMHTLVYPKNLSELVSAIHMLNTIHTAWTELLHDEDSSSLEEAKALQQQYIDEYMAEIGDFDYSCFRENLNYLLKKHLLS